MKYILLASLMVISALADASLDSVSDEQLKLARIDLSSSADGASIQQQQEVRTAEETDGDDDNDSEFESEIILDPTSDGRIEPPSVETVQNVYKSEIAKVSQEFDSTIRIATDEMQYKERFSYLTRPFWAPPLNCCPRVFNYGCRSVRINLGVFRHWNWFRYEWCYPLWRVTMARCLCKECAIQTPTCIRKGRCNSRYSRRSFLAICSRKSRWYLRYIRNKAIPTSCYCRTNKYYYTVAAKSETCAN